MCYAFGGYAFPRFRQTAVGQPVVGCVSLVRDAGLVSPWQAMPTMAEGLAGASKDALRFLAERFRLDSSGKKLDVSTRILEHLMKPEDCGD